jgi:ribosomal protein S6
MEKIKNIYECLFIADVTGGEEATKATVEKFVNLITANSETVIEVAQWGRRRLAYATLSVYSQEAVQTSQALALKRRRAPYQDKRRTPRPNRR